MSRTDDVKTHETTNAPAQDGTGRSTRERVGIVFNLRGPPGVRDLRTDQIPGGNTTRRPAVFGAAIVRGLTYEGQIAQAWGAANGFCLVIWLRGGAWMSTGSPQSLKFISTTPSSPMSTLIRTGSRSSSSQNV